MNERRMACLGAEVQGGTPQRFSLIEWVTQDMGLTAEEAGKLSEGSLEGIYNEATHGNVTDNDVRAGEAAVRHAVAVWLWGEVSYVGENNEQVALVAANWRLWSSWTPERGAPLETWQSKTVLGRVKGQIEVRRRWAEKAGIDVPVDLLETQYEMMVRELEKGCGLWVGLRGISVSSRCR
jgi:hypothetical protein